MNKIIIGDDLYAAYGKYCELIGGTGELPESLIDKWNHILGLAEDSINENPFYKTSVNILESYFDPDEKKLVFLWDTDTLNIGEHLIPELRRVLMMFDSVSLELSEQMEFGARIEAAINL